MTKTTEKAVCDGCGVDIRENTQYCYNCGRKLDVVVPTDTNGVVLANEKATAAVDLLTAQPDYRKAEDKLEDKAAKANDERKRMRVRHRRRLEYRWEPREDSPMISVIFAGFVGLVTLMVVLLLVVWK